MSLKKIAFNAAVVDAEFRYLKMDIEGAELALFQESLDDFFGYDFLAVEIDFLSLIPFRKLRLRIRRSWYMRKILRELNRNVWGLLHVEKTNFLGKTIKAIVRRIRNSFMSESFEDKS